MTRPASRHLRSAVLTVGALVGVACVLSVAASLVLGIRPLVVQSGSMSPTIGTGALAWSRQVPASELEVGDVVMVENAEGNRVTHRIVAIDRQEATAFLHLQGDANSVPDGELYPVRDAYRVFADIPYGGRVVAWLSGPWGLFLLGMYAMGLSLMVLRPRRDDEEPPRRGSGASAGKRKAARRPARAGAAGAALLVVVGVAVPARADFSDLATVTTTTLTTVKVPATTLSCGGLGLLSVTFSWTPVSNATSYTLHFGSGGSSTVDTTSTSRTITAALAGGTAWVVVNRSFGSTTWASANSNTRSYTVAVVSLCS